MRILLFRNRNYQAIRKMLRDLWELRKKILKEREIMNSQTQLNNNLVNKEIDINNIINN